MSGGSSGIPAAARKLGTFTSAFSFPIGASSTLAALYFVNNTANAMTGGFKLGTTLGGVDVIAALPIVANALRVVPSSSFLKTMFSSSTPTTLFGDAVTGWNGVNMDVWLNSTALPSA